MNRIFILFCVAMMALIAQVACYSVSNGYSHQAEVAADGGEYQYQSASHDDASPAIGGASINAADGPASYGSGQNVGYQPANTRANSVSSCISYPNNKGEILIHRPAAIIVKRPPTKVVVNHPPLVVKPAPVVLHKPPAVVVRKVFVKHHPRPVKVEPVYVNVVKPPAEKYFVNEKQQASYAPQGGYAPLSVNAGRSPSSASAGAAYSHPDVESAAASAGYQLLQNNQSLAALANLSGSSGSAYDPAPPSHSSYNEPPY